MIVDTDFEEEVVQHIEGALINLKRKVVPFPYQISGRIGLRFWGKIIIQEEAFVDDIFPPNINSLFDVNREEFYKAGTLIKTLRKRYKDIRKNWMKYIDYWKRPEEIYGRG